MHMAESSKPSIAVVVGSGAIGGTQKAAALLAGGLVGRGYRVYYICDTPGPWSDYAAAEGVQVALVEPGAGPLRDFICAVRPDIIHQHVPGGAFDNPVYPALQAMPIGPVPVLIETNVFGCLEDPAGARWVDRRMFVSRTSCVQAFRRARRPLDLDSLKEVAILPNPVLPVRSLSREERLAMRAELGVGPDEVLAVRVGRPDRRKWTNWECRAFRVARDRNPRLRLLLLEPPAELSRDVHAGKFGPGIMILPATTDFSWLSRLYGCADLMVHAAYFGESFGYTIAEAMAAGLPVITITTPYGDNAQVELVEDGLTGWVCRSPDGMARRWSELAGEPWRRLAMGDAGRARIAELAGLDGGLDVLEAVFQEVLLGEPSALLSSCRLRLLDYVRDFKRRESAGVESRWDVYSARAQFYGGYRVLRSGMRRLLTGIPWRKRETMPHDGGLLPSYISVKEPVRLAMLSDGSIGGMQKASARYAVGLARSGMAVEFIATGDGPWARHCAENGVRIRVIPPHSKRLAEALLSFRPHVIHQHVSGYDPRSYHYAAYAQVRRRLAFLVVESNVFGRLDDSQSDQWVDFRFFKSMSSLIGAYRQAGRELTVDSLQRQSVLYNPVVVPDPLPDSRRQMIRSKLGLQETDILVVRTGRPDRLKWTDWECRAFQAAHRLLPALRVVLVEPPDFLKQRIGRGVYGPGVLSLSMTDDFGWLSEIYRSADLMVHASYFGESFGYSVAEGMAAGLPVIVRSTPYGDNAQVELVENGVTGWVCMSVAEMARRMVDLAGDAGVRREMGARARTRIQELASSESGIAVLRAAISLILEGKRDEILDQKAMAILNYAVDYSGRQWRCSESWSAHPFDFAAGRLYSAYRLTRTNARRVWEAVSSC